MRSMFTKNLAIFLTASLLNTQSIKAVNFKTKPNPQGTLILGTTDQSALGAYIRQCELFEKNLATAKAAHQECNERTVSLEIWQTPAGVISISFGALVLGLIAGRHL